MNLWLIDSFLHVFISQHVAPEYGDLINYISDSHEINFSKFL
jgi:hypothetical protein